MIKKEIDYIVLRCGKGDSKAQFMLFDHYCKMVFNIAYRFTVDKDDSNDITQETFIKIFDKIRSFRGESSLEGWMRKIAVNQSIRFLERRKRLQLVMNEVEYEQKTESIEIRYDDAEELQSAIELLPDGARIVFVMYAVEGYKHNEIAKVLKISESTSKSQFHRARTLLKEALVSFSQN